MTVPVETSNHQSWRVQEKATSNTAESEMNPAVYPFGFREYDARWRYPEQINLLGLQCLGAGFGTQLARMGNTRPRVVVGHDYRSYSAAVKHAVTLGLLSAGCQVEDIGLAVTPMAYFAQQHFDKCAGAMVTASHNENGWTGLKVSDRPPITHGPKEMAALKEIVLSGEYVAGPGTYNYRPEVRDLYMDSLSTGFRLKKPLRVVVATGNGTMGAFAPDVLARVGCDVLPLDTNLDWTFPRYNPNPEDLEALHALVAEVRRQKADLGLAFDGDGDRVGVVDDAGEEIFSDKIGLLIARQLSNEYPGSKFVADVKSTGLFQEDPVLTANRSAVEYWITGHSYLKRRIHETGALAGFEKSGHFFFAPPVGRGYDDALVSAIRVLKMLDEAGQPLSKLRETLRHTWQSPTMAPYCDEMYKYQVVKDITDSYAKAKASGETICGLPIADLVTVNGVRVTLNDGTWGLVRASSNKPSLVVVTESPVSEALMRCMFEDIDRRLQATGHVGEYDQKI
jgi:phosphomannomutase/phosphoglucomutase